MNYRRQVCLILCSASACLTMAFASGAERLSFAHHCPWFTVQNQEHVGRRDFPLGMGFGDAKDDYARQIAWARQAGIDGLMVDCLNDKPGKRWTFRALRGLQKAAEQTAPGFYVFPCLDRNGLYGAEALADFISEALETQASPAWFRLDGKPVFWTYAAYSLPVTEWPKVLAKVRSGGRDLAVVCEIGGWARNAKPPKGSDHANWLPEDDLVRWGRIGPVYPFEGDMEPLMSRARALLHERGCPGASPAIGTLRPGYFAVHNGQWTPDFFTRRLREQFPRVKSLDIINITTWNDYAEDTHFEPSRNKLSCRLDLLRALIAQRKGHAWPVQPQDALWYLSAAWECYWEDEIEAEVLGLVPADTPACRVRAELVVNGRPVQERQASLASGAIRAQQFSFKLSSLPPERFVRVRVTVARAGQAPVTWHSAAILLWPQRYHPSPTRCNIATSPTATLPTGPAASPLVENGIVTRVTAEWPGAPSGVRVHINQNCRLRRICEPAPAPWDYDPSKLYNPRGPLWERFHPVPEVQRWGFFQATGITPDGRVGWGEPVWTEPKGDLAVCGVWSFDEPSGRLVKDAGIYGHDGRLQGDPAQIRCDDGYRGRCIRLDGKGQSVDLPGNISPPGPFTLSMWIRPEGEAGGMLYGDVAAAIIFHLDAGRALRLTRREETRWVSARGRTPIPEGRWTHVKARYDLETLRVYVNGAEDGSARCRGERGSQRIAIGRNPYASGSAYFRGCIDEVRLEAR